MSWFHHSKPKFDLSDFDTKKWLETRIKSEFPSGGFSYTDFLARKNSGFTGVNSATYDKLWADLEAKYGTYVPSSRSSEFKHTSTFLIFGFVVLLLLGKKKK